MTSLARRTFSGAPMALACVLSLPWSAQAGSVGSQATPTARTAAAAQQASRGNDSARIESSQGQWRGQSHAEWVQSWWRRQVSIPFNVSASQDLSGANCGILQDGPVWFLAGPLGGTASPICTIPFGKAILTPVISYFNDYPCPAEQNFEPAPGVSLEDFLTSTAVPFIDSFTTVYATLDGKPLKARRVTTRLFGFTGAPDWKVAGADACITGSPQLAVADGYYVVIDPPARGDHVLQILSDSPLFATRATFTLRIR